MLTDRGSVGRDGRRSRRTAAARRRTPPDDPDLHTATHRTLPEQLRRQNPCRCHVPALRFHRTKDGRTVRDVHAVRPPTPSFPPLALAGLALLTSTPPSCSLARSLQRRAGRARQGRAVGRAVLAKVAQRQVGPAQGRRRPGLGRRRRARARGRAPAGRAQGAPAHVLSSGRRQRARVGTGYRARRRRTGAPPPQAGVRRDTGGQECEMDRAGEDDWERASSTCALPEPVALEQSADLLQHRSLFWSQIPRGLARRARRTSASVGRASSARRVTCARARRQDLAAGSRRPRVVLSGFLRRRRRRRR